MEVAFWLAVLTFAFFGLILVALLAFLRLKKSKRYPYLMLFSLFFLYVYKVLDLTLFQYQSLLLLKQFSPGLMLNGQSEGQSLNLLPLLTLGADDVKTSLLNVLMLVPFGFGLPLVARVGLKKVVLFGALFSMVIEILQLTTGLLAGTTFRIADVNDVLFNTLGAAVGYGLFAVGRGVWRRWRPQP